MVAFAKAGIAGPGVERQRRFTLQIDLRDLLDYDGDKAVGVAIVAFAVVDAQREIARTSSSLRASDSD
jgi:hypothetical protein